jgi:hypothetical protein
VGLHPVCCIGNNDDLDVVISHTKAEVLTQTGYGQAVFIKVAIRNRFHLENALAADALSDSERVFYLSDPNGDSILHAVKAGRLKERYGISKDTPDDSLLFRFIENKRRVSDQYETIQYFVYVRSDSKLEYLGDRSHLICPFSLMKHLHWWHDNGVEILYKRSRFDRLKIKREVREGMSIAEIGPQMINSMTASRTGPLFKYR